MRLCTFFAELAIDGPIFDWVVYYKQEMEQTGENNIRGIAKEMRDRPSIGENIN